RCPRPASPGCCACSTSGRPPGATRPSSSSRSWRDDRLHGRLRPAGRARGRPAARGARRAPRPGPPPPPPAPPPPPPRPPRRPPRPAHVAGLPRRLPPAAPPCATPPGPLPAALSGMRPTWEPVRVHLSQRLAADRWTVELRRPTAAGHRPLRSASVGETVGLPDGATAELLAGGPRLREAPLSVPGGYLPAY